MATYNSEYSLVEQAKRVNPNGEQARIAEIITYENAMLFDAPWFPSNDIWTNKTVRRANKPSGTRRKINTGVPLEVSQTTEVLDVITMIETYSEPDVEYIDNMPNPMMAREQEANIFIEGMGQTLGSAMLYDNAKTDSSNMTGLAPRLGTIDSQYIWGAGGTGSDLTSIYIVTWGPMDTHMIYPRNSGPNASTLFGIKHTNKGQVTVSDATTSRQSTSQYEAYRDHYQIKAGMVTRDPRSIGRLANIESGTETSNLFDEDILIKILNRMRTNQNTRMYVNDLVLSQMQIAAKDKANINYTLGGGNGLSGEPPVFFQGIPIRKIAREILLDTEDAITT
jgi:hypothetical protein